MKATVEVSPNLLRRVKRRAAATGIAVEKFVAGALTASLKPEKAFQVQTKPVLRGKPWAKALGGLKYLRKETARINKIIDAEFEKIESGDRL